MSDVEETPEEFISLYEWMNDENAPYLPEFMRDFHDQKDLFKEIDYVFHDPDRDEKHGAQAVNWVNAHCYTVDRFLYYMATRGYTLQKSRKKNVNFRPLFSRRDERKNQLYGFLKQKNGNDNSSN